MTIRTSVRKLTMLAMPVLLLACAEPPRHPDTTRPAIDAALDKAADQRKPVSVEAVNQALLPPLVVQLPGAGTAQPEPRFDLSVNAAPASQVFMAIVSGTRYSMILHPDVKGQLSVNLKDVTVPEALDTLRDLYGFDYKVDGNRITVLPAALQTRIFQVNYLQAKRRGQTETRVSSGSITMAPTSPGTAAPGAVPAPATNGTNNTRAAESTRVTTSSDSDFWADIQKSLTAILGSANGRSVVVNPQSGVVVVRAMPVELRNVEKFLRAMQIIVERQVVLEAKIIEVTLSDSYQAGVNWAAFRDGSTRFGAGVITPGAALDRGTTVTAPTTRASDGTVVTGSALSATASGTVSGGLSLGGSAAGGLFGLALQTRNFAALLSFLETQGGINVLSSPRVATLNNQKAVLKVGTDDFFVTNVSTTSSTTGTSTTVTPTITVAPFFSGIALDVTPQIDENSNIILHIHPSVSSVTERRKLIDLGALGSFTLPLASSDVNETDTIVRVQDGIIVAIGGLMRQQSTTQNSQVPGVGNVPGIGEAFRQRDIRNTKRELVILLKPTIIHGDRNWQQDLTETRDRIRGMRSQPLPQ